MGIAALDDLVFYPNLQSVTAADMLIAANNAKAACIFRAPRTGTIDRVRFRTSTVTVGDTVDVRLETVDTATGDPTGTLIGANTNASQVILATDDNIEFEVTLTAGASVTRGQVLALVITMPAVAVGSINVTTAITNGFVTIGGHTNYTDLFTAGSWTKSGTNGFVGAVRYSDATYAFVSGMCPASSASSPAFANSSTPDERGNRFILPFAARCVGIWARVTKASTTAVLNLYDSASTLLESIAIDADIFATSAQALFGLFDTSVLLTAGQVYRMSVAPDSATNITTRELTVASAALMKAMPGGGATYLSTRTDAGAWTDTTTAVAVMGLILDGLSDSAGAGRGMPRGMVV